MRMPRLINANELLKKKADAHWALSNVVHLTYNDGRWKRGNIKEIKEDHFILIERVEGEIPVFYADLQDIEKFREPKETA